MNQCQHRDYAHGIGPRDLPCRTVRTFQTSRGLMRAELLHNGYVRVDDGGQPRLWEVSEGGACLLRSGYPIRDRQGRAVVHVAELSAVAALLRCSPSWVQR